MHLHCHLSVGCLPRMPCERYYMMPSSVFSWMLSHVTVVFLVLLVPITLVDREMFDYEANHYLRYQCRNLVHVVLLGTMNHAWHCSMYLNFGLNCASLKYLQVLPWGRGQVVLFIDANVLTSCHTILMYNGDFTHATMDSVQSNLEWRVIVSYG